ncbi:hypothetical protein CEXT_660481 [Caerostris extrusa]|uniref:Uncharacterized protein n=1 Tax=Caerostris extrusa TaxID=172846 RepID=A0AAV4SZI9_CAEEX|nr:hypothetical protein CEXT_660481 [Caerostris extrusa]
MKRCLRSFLEDVCRIWNFGKCLEFGYGEFGGGNIVWELAVLEDACRISNLYLAEVISKVGAGIGSYGIPHHNANRQIAMAMLTHIPIQESCNLSQMWHQSRIHPLWCCRVNRDSSENMSFYTCVDVCCSQTIIEQSQQ